MHHVNISSLLESSAFCAYFIYIGISSQEPEINLEGDV